MSSSHRLAVALASMTLFSASLAGRARADGTQDAWADARNIVPASATELVGVNIAALRGSTIYHQLLEMLLASEPGALKGMDMVKDVCGIDVREALQGLVVAMDDEQKGVLFVATRGVDDKAVIGCLTKVAATEKKQIDLSATTPDRQGIVAYSTTAEPRRLYLAFRPHHVIVIATDPYDKTVLQKFLGGQGIPTSSPTGKRLAHLDTAAPVWMLINKHIPIDATTQMQGVYGKADLAGGNINMDLRLILGSVAQASSAVDKFREGLDALKAGGQLPPALQATLGSLVLGNERDEVSVKMSIAETDFISLIGTLAQGQGAGTAPGH